MKEDFDKWWKTLDEYSYLNQTYRDRDNMTSGKKDIEKYRKFIELKLQYYQKS